jgi:enoyl-CoA hydratase
MPGAFQTLLLDVRDGVAVVTVNRPDKLNALNDLVVEELIRAFESLRDDASVRCAVLTGAGEKAFVAGADIGELARLDGPSGEQKARRGQGLMRLLETLGKPVLAAVNGWALGGGCELAMACTMRIAAEGARLGQPEVKLGLMAGYGGTQRLPRLVGRGKALEMLLTGEPVDAAEAHRIGLVDRVVKREALLDECRALAGKIAAAGPIAVRETIRAVDGGLDRALDAGLELEAGLFAGLVGSRDAKEGTAAFLEKRPPKFTGS